jgi:voltage-gated potassium channel
MQSRRTGLFSNTNLWDSLGTLAFVVAATVVYFVLPVPGQMRESSWALLFGLGVAVLATLIVLRIRKLLRATAAVRARSLIVLLSCAVLFFAWTDVALAAIPGQFDGLHTKIDAVYFSVSTLATVGFGDVHAAGQLARAAVTLQMLFNIVFLGTAITFVTGILRRRVQASRQQAGLPDLHSGNGGSSGPGPGPAGDAG